MCGYALLRLHRLRRRAGRDARNEKFRLYYTSECDESQSLTITVEDNFGNAFEWEVEFNNDSDAAVSDTLNVSR